MTAAICPTPTPYVTSSSFWSGAQACAPRGADYYQLTSRHRPAPAAPAGGCPAKTTCPAHWRRDLERARLWPRQRVFRADGGQRRQAVRRRHLSAWHCLSAGSTTQSMPRIERRHQPRRSAFTVGAVQPRSGRRAASARWRSTSTVAGVTAARRPRRRRRARST